MFHERAKATHIKTYEMQGWLNQFIQLVGSVEKGKELLKGIGEIKDPINGSV